MFFFVFLCILQKLQIKTFNKWFGGFKQLKKQLEFFIGVLEYNTINKYEICIEKQNFNIIFIMVLFFLIVIFRTKMIVLFKFWWKNSHFSLP